MRGGGMRGGGRGGGRRMMGPAPMFLPGMGPMMMIPAGPAPLMAPMIIAPGFDGGRGWGGGGRGGGLGGRGGIRPAPGSYVDLDDPKNSRQVLDYGDL